MSGSGGSRTLAVTLLVVSCAAAASEPVVVRPGDGPQAALEIKEALERFMQMSESCNSAADTMACICGEAAVVERLDAALESALEQHPDWRERALQYKGYEQDSTLQIGIPALQQQMSMMTSRCER